jgi:hypothetical protein
MFRLWGKFDEEPMHAESEIGAVRAER